MKVAITSKGPELSSQTDPRFGRGAYIIIIDSESKEFEAIDNSANVNAFKGAGIQAATLVAEKKVDVLMTGHCGPNAFKTLDAVGIKVVNDISGNVEDAFNKLMAGDVQYATGADVEGHW